MTTIANFAAREHVQSCSPFKGSNIFGDTLTNGIYAVWSYGTHWPLFAKVGDQWYENEGRYSVTTNKHRSQCHPHAETIKVSCDELRRIIEA